MANEPDVTLKIALSGKSVHSKDFINDFMFVGGLPTVQIKRRMKIKCTTDAGASGFGSARVEHGFGYKPQVIAFVTTRPGTTFAETYTNVPGSWNDGDEIFGEQGVQVFDCYVDEQNVYVSALAYRFVPMVSTTYLTVEYTFDVLLLMEEAITV